jgi:hypothetical protein
MMEFGRTHDKPYEELEVAFATVRITIGFGGK